MIVAGLTLSVALLGACDAGAFEPIDGRASPSLSVYANTSSAVVSGLSVEVAAADISPSQVFNIPVNGGQASATFRVTVGSDRTFTVRAFDAGGTETHRGTETVDVLPADNPPLSITLMPLQGEQELAVTVGSIIVVTSPAADTTAVGDSLLLTAAVLDSLGETISDASVQWSSITPSLASVDSRGMVLGLEPGDATIAATYGQVGSSSTIHVVEAEGPAATVTITPASETLVIGGTTRFSATARDAEGNVLVSKQVTWSSSDESVASIDGAGLVTAHGLGSATITAEVDDVSGTAAIEVESSAIGSGYYVSPTGRSDGDGSVTSPWDLEGVLQGNYPVAPGDTVWVRGGTYQLGVEFDATIAGTQGNPVIIRQYPGERARVDGTINQLGGDVWWWGLEIFRSNPDRNDGTIRQTGIEGFGARTKFINIIVHDHNNNGIGFWLGAVGGEIHGAIVYNNGNVPNHPHGIYTQNDPGEKKLLRNSIVFNNSANNLNLYSDGDTSVRNYDLVGMVLFGAGTTDSGQNLVVKGGGGEDDIHIRESYGYGDNWNIGSGGPSTGLRLEGNYLAGGLLTINEYAEDVSITGNTIVAPEVTGMPIEIVNLSEAEVRSWHVDENDVWMPNARPWLARIQPGDIRYEFEGWQALGHDPNGSFTTEATPAENKIFVIPMADEFVDEFEPKRAHVVIYNWERLGSLGLDLSRVLSSGEAYEVRTVHDPFGSPVAEGIFNGSEVVVPMAAIDPPLWTNLEGSTPKSTAPDFDVFIITVRK